jgi:predicted phosphodiesterase
MKGKKKILLELLLKKQEVEIKEASRILKCHETKVLELANKLSIPIEVKDNKIIISHSQGKKNIYRNFVKILIISNTRLGLVTQQLSLIKDFLTTYGKEIDFVILLGNIIAGKPKKGQEDHYFLKEFDEQIDYFVKNWPVVEGLKFYLINGPRDLSFPQKDAALAISERRKDCVYCGSFIHEFPITQTEHSLIAVHPKASRSVYTISYPLNNVYQSIKSSFIDKRSRIIVVGGLHVIYYNPIKQLVAIPSLSNPLKDIALEKKSISPTIGVTEIEIEKKKEFKPRVRFFKLDKYASKNDYLTWKFPDNLKGEKKKIVERLKEQEMTAGEIARTVLKREISHTKDLLQELVKKEILDYNPLTRKYKLHAVLKEKFDPQLDFKKIVAQNVVHCYASDTHIGAIRDCPEAIVEMFKICKENQITEIFIAGDIFEGCKHFAGQENETYLPGLLNSQLELALEIFKHLHELKLIDNQKIYLISGGHDLESRKEFGLDLVELFVNKLNTFSENFIYLGRYSGVYNDALKVKVVHPSGGVPKGESYRIQEFIENECKIDVLLLGHLHVPIFLVYQHIVGIQAGCFKSQDEYLVRKGKNPGLGFWIIHYGLDKDKDIVVLQPSFHPIDSKLIKKIEVIVEDGKIKIKPNLKSSLN